MNKPIECSAEDKLAAQEAFEYCLFSLQRHGIDISSDDSACRNLLLAIVHAIKD